MRRWILTWAVGSFAVGVGFAQPILPTSPTNDLREPVRVRLLRLPSPPSTNSLFLSIHRTPRHVTFSAPRFDSYLGGAIAPAGDVNGDGFVDVLVSARRYSKGRLSRAGAGMLLPGSSTGLVANAGWSFVGERANGQFGHALAGGCDVNGDGLPDMAISTLHRMNTGGNRGALNLFYGRTSAISDSRDWQYMPEAHDGQLGDSLAMADFNDDGFADLIAGASRHTKSLEKEGGAFLFLGGRTGLPDAPNWSVFGGATNSGFGDCIVAPGDVNGDGFPDILIGAPRYPVNKQSTGRVFLFTGGPKGLSPTPAWTADGFKSNSQFGLSISGTGDLNGDGCADFLVGAPQPNSTDPAPGTAFLFFGAKSYMSTNPTWISSGEMPSALFGTTVAGVGDVNGDGLSDAIVGSPNWNLQTTGPGREGRAYLYLGVKGGIESNPSWIVEGSDRFLVGHMVVGLGDLNRDGFSDFAISLQERSRFDVFYGAATGYNRGDTFPTDGLSARNVLPQVVAPELNTNSTPSPFAREIPRPQNSSRTAILLGLALLPVVLGGMFAIMLKRQRAAANSERARIAKDLHDDLGARLTSLSLLMDPASRQTTESSSAENHDEKIARAAREILTSMDEVIWSENPESDTLENLVTFIIQYASPFFAPTPVRCQCDAPTHLPKRKVSAEARKNIFLAVKEALNNAAKHADATTVRIEIRFAEPLLTILIEDNGRGLPVAVGNEGSATPAPISGRGGNGLGNMRQRMIAIGGTFDIRSTPGAGARVTLQARL